MNKIKELTVEQLHDLPTGTVLLLQKENNTSGGLVMVLRGVTAHSVILSNIYSGDSWGYLENLKTHTVLEIWHPDSNRAALLNGRITTKEHELVYKQDTAKRDKIATLKLQVEELKKTIESLEG
jgi:hypothetical protein